MARLRVSEQVAIDRSPELVRSQFGDVAHHEATGVHDGVEFHVVSDDGSVCRYRQISRVGPLRLRQHFELPRAPDGPLVNTITKGQFSGGSITFEIGGEDDGPSTVTATLDAPLSGPAALIGPLLRRVVSSSLRAALVEDKADLESGRYQPP